MLPVLGQEVYMSVKEAGGVRSDTISTVHGSHLLKPGAQQCREFGPFPPLPGQVSGD